MGIWSSRSSGVSAFPIRSCFSNYVAGVSIIGSPIAGIPDVACCCMLSASRYSSSLLAPYHLRRRICFLRCGPEFPSVDPLSCVLGLSSSRCFPRGFLRLLLSALYLPCDLICRLYIFYTERTKYELFRYFSFRQSCQDFDYLGFPSSDVVYYDDYSLMILEICSVIQSPRAPLIFHSSTPVSVLTVLPVCLRSCANRWGGVGSFIAFCFVYTL